MRCDISFIKEMNVFKHRETTSGPDLYVDCICQDWPTPPLGDLTLVYYQINNFKRRMQNLVKHFKMELFAKFQVDRCCFAFFSQMLKVLCQHVKRQPHKMVKHTQKIRRLQPRICLSVFDHFVGLAFKWLDETTLASSILYLYAYQYPGLYKFRSCVRQVLEIINFENSHTSLFFQFPEYVKELKKIDQDLL